MVFFTKDLPSLQPLINAGVVEIGEWTYGPLIVMYWGEQAKLRVGRYCSIADGVQVFLGGGHQTTWVSTYPFTAEPIRSFFPELADCTYPIVTRGDVTIGHDVWLGSGAKIMSGCSIGHGAVVGAGAVVAHDVPPYAVVAGNPAAVRRFRFPDETIKRLVTCAWWDWDIDDLKPVIRIMMSDDISSFLHYAENFKNATRN
jgi:acetyltransferase-like isoleucine patch superfamily enzyme